LRIIFVMSMGNKEKIIEVAAELFRTYGIKSVTMDSLAMHLGMSKRTIYEIFTDKDELLIGVLKWMAEMQKELVKRVLGESENAIVAIFKLLEINRDHFQNMSPVFQSDMKRFHYEVLMKRANKSELPDFRSTQEVIERGVKEKLFRKDVNIDIVNRCVDSLVKSVMNNDLFPFDEFSRRDVIGNVIINYLRGISTNEGIDLINKLEKKL
jgi:TetR/AcrR family transcriptional regulator, cholesterol catabolism regulator